LSGQQVPSFGDLYRELDIADRVTGEGIENLTREFLHLLERGLTEVAESPQNAFISGLLREALDTLGRLPLLESEVTTEVGAALADRAFSMVLGLQTNWIQRTLESVNDERKFQRLLLRLLQAGHPRFAQVRDGPMEYGKDVVALVGEGPDLVLEMYQAKKGDISLPDWRAVKPQLEEMFEVDLPAIQVDASRARRVGVLVFNGHLTPQAEPAVAGWMAEQERRGREVQIMHLDVVVNWILEHRLVSAFRAALDELGISVVD
jgi:hypothetical protein